ncbi:MAG: BBP7 family outer membrane beta-barrel protein [Gemmatales bacterium]|nr:BBP7 family outer membrane beta-barrel protein [Gemmatales bacterium]MDW8387550.1 BBP7 family outer membrane beta-barrel protein [Gemmatales bacterium]
MRKRLLGSVGAVLAAAGMACGQVWANPPAAAEEVKEAVAQKEVKPTSCCDSKPVPGHLPPVTDPCLPCLPYNPPIQEDAPFSIHNRMFLSGETLVWWLKDGRINVPLITTTSDPLTTGILGEPGTSVVFGNTEVEHNAFVGARLTGGFVLDEKKVWALEASGFWLAQQSDVFRVNGNEVASGILARPYLDAANGVGASALDAFPSAFAGGVIVETTSELWGGEINLVKNLFRIDCLSMDFLVGGRFLNLEESVSITDTFLILNAGIGFFNGVAQPEGRAISRNDLFETRNRFYGGQIGARLEYRFGTFYVLGKMKVALGITNQEVAVDGTSSLFANDALVDVTPGGLLALTTNIGTTSRDEFSAVPEASVNIGWHVTPRIRVFAGYTFLYWSDVLRPGEQIDLRVNPGILPTAPTGQFGVPGGPPVPTVLQRSNDFYAHGMNFGVALRF